MFVVIPPFRVKANFQGTLLSLAYGGRSFNLSSLLYHLNSYRLDMFYFRRIHITTVGLGERLVSNPQILGELEIHGRVELSDEDAQSGQGRLPRGPPGHPHVQGGNTSV